MSTCNDYAEFACHLTLATGAPPHLVLPIARRFRRLATTHQRRCETQCNGCRTCQGSGYVVLNRKIDTYETDPPSDARPCPTCSTDTIEDAIKVTLESANELCLRIASEDRERAYKAGRAGEVYETRNPSGAAAYVRGLYDGATNADRPTLERLALVEAGPLRPIFQYDPRGATVRIKLPTHREDDYGIAVPKSIR